MATILNRRENRNVYIWGTGLVLLWGAVIFSIAYWWQYNRMDIFYCVLGGNKLGDDNNRWSTLFQHSEMGKCAPLDEDKHWALMKKASEEWNWAEAHFFMSLLHGYGYFFNENLDDIYVVSAIQHRKLNPYEIQKNEEVLYRVRKNFGSGENVDYDLSFHLLEDAAMSNEMHIAKGLISYAYYAGEWGKNGKIKRDIDKSTQWLEVAAKNSSICRSSFYLGYRYRYGIEGELPPNDKKAYQYFRDAYKKLPKDVVPEVSCINAIVEIALMYAEGVGVNRNVQRAEELINEASEITSRHRDIYHPIMQEYIAENKKKILTFL